jgi:FkbM family methyltransferase
MKKTFNYLYSHLLSTLRIKFAYSHWVSCRKYLSNWYLWYFISSSFIMHILTRLLRNRSSVMNYIGQHRSGLIFLYPLSLYINHYSQIWRLAYYQYDEAFMSHYGYNIKYKDGDVVIDIGAHTGGFSAPLSFHNRKIKIYSIEPDIVNYYTLQLNCEKNSHGNSIVCHNIAISDESGHTSFIRGQASTSGHLSSIEFSLKGNSNEICGINTLTLEDYFEENNISSCKLLKMDCEGAEYSILFNSSPQFIKNIEYIFLEIHPIPEFSMVSLIEYMEEIGYTYKYDITTAGCYEVYFVRNQ